MTEGSPGNVPFEAHIGLLHLFLAHRSETVERIQSVLNARRKPMHFFQDSHLLSRQFGECFFWPGIVTSEQSRLRGQLEEAHWSSGFRPRQMPGLHNDLVDPAEMMMRGFHFWQQTRWPGRNARVRFAQTLYNLYLIRSLELLSMRLWDAEAAGIADRLALLQVVLDELRKTTPADQPVIVRDARWLIPLAQSPTTDELGGYFEVSKSIADTFPEEHRTEIRKASVHMIGGHLRSQIRHYCMKNGVSIDDHDLVLRTRTSNALDFALLIQGLVPLLDAYECALENGDDVVRFEMAGAICQGISADPELFVNRVDLLGAYSMIEHLFVTADGDGKVGYSPMGHWHGRLLADYAARIGRLVPPLSDDCSRFRPVDGGYSPYGAIYGTPSALTELMALKTLLPDAVPRFSLEDVFTDGDAGSGKLAWVGGWRKMPHIDPAVQTLYDYPQQFAEDVFGRIERTLLNRESGAQANAGNQSGRLFIVSGDDRQADPATLRIPDLPVRYIRSSDAQIIAAGAAESCDEAQLLCDRREGEYAVSFQTPGGWLAVSKDMLTEVLGAGQDARIAGYPRVASDVLRMMCPNLVAEPDVAQASTPPSMLKA